MLPLLLHALALTRGSQCEVRANMVIARITRPSSPRLSRSRSADVKACWLPGISAQDVPQVALLSGGVAATAQLGLSQRFQSSQDYAISKTAGYRAHHMIAFSFMVFATTLGCATWLSHAQWEGPAASRLLVPVASSDSVRLLAAVLLGELLLWDLPTALFVPKLRRPDMIIHHVAMAVVAALVAYYPVFYGAYYLGFIELTTLPLTANELLAATYDAAESEKLATPSVATNGEHSALDARLLQLGKWRDATQIVAAVSFVLVRGFDFTRVTTTDFIPEALAVIPTLESPDAAATLYAMVGFTVAFNLLQLYWLVLLVKYTQEQGVGGKRPE